MENNLLEMVKQKEQADKHLLSLELVAGVLMIILLLALTMFASPVQMGDHLRVMLIVIGLIPIFIATPFMLKTEQTAGCYECGKCGHRYVSSYSSVLWAMHVNRTRYMRCPVCNRHGGYKHGAGILFPCQHCIFLTPLANNTSVQKQRRFFHYA